MSDIQTAITPEHLKKTLDVIGVTDGSISKIAGISQSTLYRWMNGSVPIHPGVMLLLEVLSIKDIWNNQDVQKRISIAVNRK